MRDTLNRSLIALCAAVTLLPQIYAAGSTVYTPAPYSTISTIDTKTFASGGLVPAGIPGNGLVLSADGNTFYVAGGHMVVAVDRATGNTLRTYPTQHPLGVPLALALTPNQAQIYVSTCSGSFTGCKNGHVEVLDTSSGQSLAVIPFGYDQVYGIASAPDGTTAYAVHYSHFGGSSRALTAIDVASLQPRASLALPAEPSGIVVMPDGQTAFVLADPSLVYQVGIAQFAITATVNLAPGYGPQSMALSQDGTTLAVLNINTATVTGQVSFIDTVTLAVSEPVQSVASNPTSLVSISADGKTVYFCGQSSDYVSGVFVVDAQAGKVVTELDIGDVLATLVSSDGQDLYMLHAGGAAIAVLPEGSLVPSKLQNGGGPVEWLALSPDGQTLYAASSSGIWAISTSTGQVTAKMLQHGDGVLAVAVSPDGQTLYVNTSVNNGAAYNFLILSASTGKTGKSIPLPEQLIYSGTGALAVTPTGDRVYASSPGGPVVVIDTQTQSIVASIPGTIGSGLAISPAGDRAYITTSSPNSLTDVVDLSTNQVIGTLPLTSIGIVFSADGARAYLSTYGNSSPGAYAIAVVDTSTLAVLDFVAGAFGGSGESLALTSDGKLLYAGGLSPTQATPVWAGAMIDTQSLKVVHRFAAGPVVVIR